MMISEEKAGNIRALFRGGMSKNAIARKLKMTWEAIDKICAGIPDPHDGNAQPLFTSLHLRQKRRGTPLPRGFELSDTDW